MVRYQTGGGSKGNVGHNTISILRENIPYIVSVNNPYPSEGGSDLEDIQNLKNRATNVFKNLNRAVTIEDYEWLAKEASFSIARSKCLSKVGKSGEITVIIVPRPDADDFDLKRKLEPTLELVRRVKEFLNARKLVGTKLKIEPPIYRNASINLKLVFKKDIAEIQTVKERIDLSLRRYLHPITGGPSGEGWPFGMPLIKNDIFSVLETIEEIYYLEDMEIIDDEAGISVEKLVLDEDSLIFINSINISERKMQF
jgi:predicted phage baseplate assembly protein